jgi:hypothetical protein
MGQASQLLEKKELNWLAEFTLDSHIWMMKSARFVPLVLLCFALGNGMMLAAIGDRISVSGTEFRAGTNRIWINGVNTPWHEWNDFGGNFDAAWWDHHFAQLQESGVNAARVWFSCNGEVGINIDSTGQVAGCTEKFWRDADALFQIARQHQIYIDATLISFDHFKNHHKHYRAWRNMLADKNNIDAMVTNYVVPFVVRYRDNPWLWSADLCNEPDWIHQNAECGRLPWDGFQTYVAKAAAAIHANSPALVTVGFCMGPKYTARPPGTNILSDQALQAHADGDAHAHLDFYTPHYYDWMSVIRGNAFYQTPGDYTLDTTKPIVIGECPAKGTEGHTVAQDYESALANGWQGVMGWSSDGVDENGSLADLSFATKAMCAKHRALVFPQR